jgi:hypothetical protein
MMGRRTRTKLIQELLEGLEEELYAAPTVVSESLTSPPLLRASLLRRAARPMSGAGVPPTEPTAPSMIKKIN